MLGSVRKWMVTLSLLLLAAGSATAAEMVSSTARALSAVSNMGGYGIVPAGTQPASYGDLAPIQLFEITKPAGQSVTIARMFTSCTCVQLEADKRTYGPGERVILRLRNVLATPPGGMTYALYVQFATPAGITLRYDTYVQSAQFVPAPDGTPPTRGNIVADGVLAPSVNANIDLVGGANIEMIVPKAENYIPDTSEYSQRKRVEQKNPEEMAEADSDTVKDGVQPLDRSLITADAETEKATAAKAVAAADPERKPLDRNLLEPGSVPASEPEKTVASGKQEPARSSTPSQVRMEIDSAITQVEQNYNRGTTTPASDRSAAGAVSQQPRIATTSEVTTSQEVKYQTEARQIGRDILEHRTAPAQKAAASGGSAQTGADSDELWRTPRPRGAVRTTGSLSRSGTTPTATAPGTGATATAPSTPSAPSTPAFTASPTLPNVPAARNTAAAVRDAGRALGTSVNSAESAVAGQVRGAFDAGRGASQTTMQNAATNAATALQNTTGNVQGAIDAARSGVADSLNSNAPELFRTTNKPE